jgi:ligand-binding sensor domain-containing protein
MKKKNHLPNIKILAILLGGSLVLLLLAVYFFAIKPAEEAIEDARLAVEGLPLEFERSSADLTQFSQTQKHERIISKTGFSDFHDICFLNGYIYAASNGGLMRIRKGSASLASETPNPCRDEKTGGGKTSKKAASLNPDERKYLKKYYAGLFERKRDAKLDDDYYVDAVFTINNGLRENRIKAVKPWNGKLLVVYDNSGIALMDGKILYNYIFKQQRYNKVCIASPGRENILMITDTADIIEFNGESFKLLKNEVLNPKKHIISSICRLNDGLLIGTVSSGLYYYNYDKAVAEKNEIFVSNKINGILNCNERILVNSESGVYERRRNNDYLPIVKDYPVSASAIRNDGTLVCGTYFGEILEIGVKGGIKSKKVSQRSEPIESVLTTKLSQDAGQKNMEFAVTGSGILRINSENSVARIGVSSELNFLNANFVTSLEIDNNGRIWVGYFENGIDVLDSDLKAIAHLENDDIRVVRHLKFDSSRSLMYAASSKGIMVFDSAFRYRKIDAERGLISNEVSNISLMKEGAVYCTAGGVTFDRGGILRSIYAFHNLANNHTYCSIIDNDKVYVGTLGGLSIIENLKVRDNLTPLNSPLPNNWVTAILKDETGNIWIGTYGGGISRIGKNGKWDEVKFPYKDIEINNNAMILSDNMLFAGTLSDGIIMYNYDTGEWQRFSGALPSRNVTAFLSIGNKLVIGTDAGLVVSDIISYK